MHRDIANIDMQWKAILDYANKATSFADGLSLQQFIADKRTNYAVVDCLELVADASEALHPEVRARFPQVPWSSVIEAGDFYLRHYDRVSLDNVWRSLHDEIPILVAAAEAELGRPPDR